jgi:hypothetical protein
MPRTQELITSASRNGALQFVGVQARVSRSDGEATLAEVIIKMF